VNRQNEYLLTRVRSASPMELVGILYETAIQSTEEALAHLRSGDILNRGRAVNKAVEIIFELQRSLRHDVQPQYSQNLAGLYSYMQSRLAEAQLRKSEAMFQEVSRLLRTLQEGWSGAMESQAARSQAHEADPEASAAGTTSPYLPEVVSGSKQARSWCL
jgi:flagellar secretion chaperone FliS